MDRILIILKKENRSKASSALTLGLNTIILKHVYWYTYICSRSQVSVYRTIGPLVYIYIDYPFLLMLHIKFGFDWPSGFRGNDV